MVLVNKQEKMALLEKFPSLHTVRTMKQDSKRHHYYVEELPVAMKYLRTLRGERVRNKRK